MRFTRRSVSDGAPTEVLPAPDVAPRGHPVAAFAGILDGRSLWIAVEARPGTPALRDATSGEVIVLPCEAADDQPAYRGARLDLVGLPTSDATYDVVVVPPGGRNPVTIWTPPLTGLRPSPALDDRTQHTLHRTTSGMLQVRRTTLPAAATLTTVSARRDGIRIALAGGGATLAILGEGDAVLASWPANDGVVVVTAEAVSEVEPQVARAVTGAPGDWLPIRRRANDLADPGRSAPLPQLYADGPDNSADPRLRLRWSGNATLQMRIFG